MTVPVQFVLGRPGPLLNLGISRTVLAVTCTSGPSISHDKATNKKLCYTAQLTAGPRLIYLFIGVCPLRASVTAHRASVTSVLDS